MHIFVDKSRGLRSSKDGVMFISHGTTVKLLTPYVKLWYQEGTEGWWSLRNGTQANWTCTCCLERHERRWGPGQTEHPGRPRYWSSCKRGWWVRATPSARKLLFETAESTTQRVRGEEAFLCTPRAGDTACAYQLAYYITEESIVLSQSEHCFSLTWIPIGLCRTV